MCTSAVLRSQRFSSHCFCGVFKGVGLSATSPQGRSQKFVFGGISFFGGIKLLNSRSDVILPHKKFTWADLGGINTDIHPRCYAPASPPRPDHVFSVQIQMFYTFPHTEHRNLMHPFPKMFQLMEDEVRAPNPFQGSAP